MHHAQVIVLSLPGMEVPIDASHCSPQTSYQPKSCLRSRTRRCKFTAHKLPISCLDLPRVAGMGVFAHALVTVALRA